MSTTPTFNRLCCGQPMERSRRYPDGSEQVHCRRCERTEEVSASGYAIPHAAATRAAPTVNLLAEIGAGLPAELQALL